jgi:hypothetical protein
VWKIEALNQTYFALGLDTSNAHVQPGGAYHYHGMPEGYITRLGKGTGMALVGFAVDGFPMYARYGYNTATNAASGTKVMVSSYRTEDHAQQRPAVHQRRAHGDLHCRTMNTWPAWVTWTNATAAPA